MSYNLNQLSFKYPPRKKSIIKKGSKRDPLIVSQFYHGPSSMDHINLSAAYNLSCHVYIHSIKWSVVG